MGKPRFWIERVIFRLFDWNFLGKCLNNPSFCNNGCLCCFRFTNLHTTQSKTWKQQKLYLKHDICLQLPVIEAPINIFKDLKSVFSNFHATVFIIFAFLTGVVDSLGIYFLFWYLSNKK